MHICCDAIMTSYFFLSCNGAHVYVHRLTHSFPTRRSSDLQQDQEPGEEDVELLLHRQRPGVQQRPVLRRGGEVVRGLPEVEVGDEERGRRCRAGDRMSTRLNSSH